MFLGGPTSRGAFKGEFMLKKKVIALGVMAISASLMVAPSIQSANAALKPDFKANVGDECLRAGKKAVGRGVNGTDLTCTNVTTGSFAGTLRWWYPEMKPYGSVEFVSSSNIGGGYGTTAIAVGDAMKKEGLLTDYTVTYRSNAPLGLGYFYDQKARKDLLLITGFAMPGGLATNGSKLEITTASAVAGIMREAEAFAVPTSSKYKTINDLLADIKANPKAVAIGGGNYGGVDHVTVATLAGKITGRPASVSVTPYKAGKTGTTNSTAFLYTVKDAAGNGLEMESDSIVLDTSSNSAVVTDASGNGGLDAAFGGAYGDYVGTGSITCGVAGSSDVVLKYTNTNGTVIKSAKNSMRCAGGAYCHGLAAATDCAQRDCLHACADARGHIGSQDHR